MLVGVSDFFLRFSVAVHTSRVNYDEMTKDRPRQWVNRNCYGCRASHELCSNYLLSHAIDLQSRLHAVRVIIMRHTLI